MLVVLTVCLVLLTSAAADKLPSAVYGRGSSGAGRGPGGPAGGRGQNGPPVGSGLYKTSSVHFKTPSGGGPGVVHQTGGPGGPVKLQYGPSPYSFDYTVNNYESGAQYAANENSDGKQTKGYYKVALPDGRTQTVTYSSDEHGGFVADVSYEGEAVYPERSQYAIDPKDYGKAGSAPRGHGGGIGAVAVQGGSRYYPGANGGAYKIGGPPGYKAPVYRPTPYGTSVGGGEAGLTGKRSLPVAGAGAKD